MMNIAQIGQADVDVLLSAVAEQLAAREEQWTIVIAGGSALLALGLVSRTTKDVDVVAVLDGDELVSATPLPEALRAAASVVGADFNLPDDWLNDGPASLVELGLPEGFLDRATRRDFGSSLVAVFASRLDQIYFKLYAVVDQGPGRHLADLQSLAPTASELVAAARWSRTHDPSDGYREVLFEVLDHFGVVDGLEQI